MPPLLACGGGCCSPVLGLPPVGKIRHTELGSHSKAALLRLFGADALLTGIIPEDRALFEAQSAAEACGVWPATGHLPRRV